MSAGVRCNCDGDERRNAAFRDRHGRTVDGVVGMHEDDDDDVLLLLLLRSVGE
jgi:hypothetical protein